MKKDTVVELRRPAQGQDLLSTMLRDGAQRLVAQAVQAEFEEFLARFSGERDRGRTRGGGAQRLSARARDAHGAGVGARANSEGALARRGAGGVSLRAGAAVRAPGQERGGGAAVAVLARGVHRRHAGGAGRAAGSRGGRAVGLGGGAAQGCWREEYRRWRRAKLGQGSLGVPVGRRHLLGAARRGRAPVRAGGDRRERARAEEAPRDRGRGARIETELA